MSQGAFGIVSILVVIPKLSNTDLGYIAALETLTYLFATAAGFNLDRAASRFYFDSENEANQKDLFTTLNLFSVMTVGLCVTLVVIFRFAVARVFPTLTFWPLMVLGLARISLDIAGRIEQSYLVASGRSGRFAFGTILSGAIMIASASYMVVWLSYGVIGYLLAQVIAALFLLVFLGLASWHVRGWGRWQGSILSEALSYAWPFAPTLVVAWVMSYYDRILVGRRFGIETLGVYGLSLRFAAPLLLVSTAITRAIYPTFYSVYGSTEAGPSERLAFARSVIYVFGALALSAMTIGRMVFHVAYGTRADEALTYFAFIIVTYWISAVAFLSSESLMLAKATKANMVLGLGCAAVSLGLNYLLIPMAGIKGAVASGAITALGAFGAQLYLARRYITFAIPARSYAYVLAVLVTTALVSASCRSTWSVALLFVVGVALLGRGVVISTSFLRAHG